MNTLDDWPRVKRVLEGALACDDSERQAYLAEACGADAVLRARIDRLLAAGDRVETFLETPAALLLEPDVREDLTGRVVDSYRLLSRLGAGGMGEVYLAHDAKLDRPVAVKFLSPDLAVDRDRLRRFHQEARAASSLNHPHIVVVHDFGEVDDRPYLVTEFIEGETLRRRLQRGALAMPDVVDIGVQVASALAAAHARGLVHRDVKPENIMLRPDGYAKVLDFGLAKLAAPTWIGRPSMVGTCARDPAWWSERRVTCRRSRCAASMLMLAATCGASVWCCTRWRLAGFRSPKMARASRSIAVFRPSLLPPPAKPSKRFVISVTPALWNCARISSASKSRSPIVARRRGCGRSAPHSRLQSPRF